MRTPPLLLVAPLVAAIACSLSPTGLGSAGGPDGGGAGTGPSGRVTPDPAGFAGMAEDTGRAADASTPSPDAAPLPADASALPADVLAADLPPPSSPPPPPPPSADAAPAPDAAPVAPPLGPRVLRVHDLKVGKLTALVVHAHELEAASGSTGLLLPADPDALLKLEQGKQDLEVPELTVDVLYAHDIKAAVVHIAETHAHLKTKGHED